MSSIVLLSAEMMKKLEEYGVIFFFQLDGMVGEVAERLTTALGVAISSPSQIFYGLRTCCQTANAATYFLNRF